MTYCYLYTEGEEIKRKDLVTVKLDKLDASKLSVSEETLVDYYPDFVKPSQREFMYHPSPTTWHGDRIDASGICELQVDLVRPIMISWLIITCLSLHTRHHDSLLTA